MGASRSSRTEARWRSLIAAQEHSGESVAQFAAQRGLNAATLYWWRSQLRRRDQVEPEFVPIEIVDAKRATDRDARAGFELELRGGRRLRVPPGFDADELARLISAIERAC